MPSRSVELLSLESFHPRARLWRRTLLAILLAAGAASVVACSGGDPASPSPDPGRDPDEQTEGQRALVESRTYKVIMVAADVDTSLDAYQSTPGGLADQCTTLNSLLDSVCCEAYEIGCSVDYVCEPMADIDVERLSGTAYVYERELGRPNYAMHHGSVQEDVGELLTSLRFHPRMVENPLVVAYTKHAIRIDDEETKDPTKKIDPQNLAFHFLGSLLPGLSQRGGRQILLDYYASRLGLLLTVSPSNEASLAQAMSERKAGSYSFEGKKLTGTGARDLFELNGGGLVPNRTGCAILSGP